MQQLHLVGFTSDRRGLVFSVKRGAKSGSYVVDLDDALIDAIRPLRARRSPQPDDAAKPDSALTVREMQSRLRRGASLDDVASAAGVDQGWVERFAAPVFAEQAEVIRALRAFTFDKPRHGQSAVPLGEAVYRNLADRGVNDPEDVLDEHWQAWQLRDGVWQITFRHAWRGQEHEPTWELDQNSGTVRALSRLAADLAFRPDETEAPAGPVRRVAAARPKKEPPAEIQLSLPVEPSKRRRPT